VTALGLEAFGLVGHSSGGHLAVWATGDSGRAPAVTVAISGIMDLEQAERDGLGDGAVTRFDPGHATSAMRAPPPPAPIALIHGESDTVVPPTQSISYSAHLRSHGAPVTLDLVNGGHFDALDPQSDAWATAVARLAEHLG
jgi:acetyl esterase/lipase